MFIAIDRNFCIMKVFSNRENHYAITMQIDKPRYFVHEWNYDKMLFMVAL